MAGIGQARGAGDLAADRPTQVAAGVDFTICDDGRDRRQQEDRHQRRQSRLLDAGRAPFPLAAHRSTVGRLDARVARWDAREGAASAPLLTLGEMEGGFNIFGDPEEFRARMEELSEQMQSSQRVAWADNAIKLAVEMTVASIGRLELSGSPDEQAMQVRDAIRSLFPEAVTLVREAREGLS